jgi:hypothetical protein
MPVTTRALCFGLPAFFLSACTQYTPSGAIPSHISAAAVLSSEASPQDKAETLAKQAETLLTAQGFLQAAKVVEQALKEDPHNFRAGLVNALLGPALEMKGMMVRPRPLFEKNPALLSAFENDVKKNQARPASTLKDYVFDGKPDIFTEEQLQDTSDRFTQKLDDLRIFLRNAKTQEITVKANTFLVPNINERFAEACDIVETANFEFTLKCPPSEKRFDVTLNPADFAALRDFVATQEIQFAMYGSYDLSGAVEAAKQDANMDAESFAQALSNKIFENPHFGKLRPQTKIQKIKEFALDFVSGMRAAMLQQTQLCPKSYENPKNRPGMLFNEGICAGAYLDPYMKDIEAKFSGNIYSYTSAPLAAGTEVKMYPMKLIATPVVDLRSLGKLTFDKCGNLIAAGDPTFGGTFPAGDANSFFAKNEGLCK